MQNDHISQQLDDKVLELERGWKQKREQKPQQQCFNKWDAPCYPPGHSVWPHQNNLSPRKYFNKPDGPCVLGYACLPPVQLGRHNYQPLWRSHHHQNSS
uniref:Uncharacterized protein n=3 Tax=Triticinae TaxID=1648030 RepID=A0A453AYA7_AEGTS